MAGGQDDPHAAYLVALNAGLRYHFRTGTRFVPFIGGTVGIALSDIDDADATGKFQFNQQVGGGVRYFFDKSTAVTLDYAIWHVSNAGLAEPNDGVNAHIFSLGLTWLF
jgi:predicted porin